MDLMKSILKWIFSVSVFLSLILISHKLKANEVGRMDFWQKNNQTDWSKNASLPSVGDEKFSYVHRANILNLSVEDLKAYQFSGFAQALHYPVTATEMLIPLNPLMKYLNSDFKSPLKKYFLELLSIPAPFEDRKSFQAWLGIGPYPKSEESAYPQNWPEPSAEEKWLGVGATVIEKYESKALTFSCAVCHSADLFGKRVVGLTNRFPRANEFFHAAEKISPFVSQKVFKHLFEATENEAKVLKDSLHALNWVGTKKPQVLGLDTSLAQVALSLAKRENDPYAERTLEKAKNPDKNALQKMVADSKPAVWWNLKYKTRWLSDGSVVQGNPILTNFLWNEIGRGTDLYRLEDWLNENQKPIEELTAFVFSLEAPRYLDFLDEKTLDLEMAKRGEKHFVQNCQGCHGKYEKNWSLSEYANADLKEQTKNAKVWYHKQTPVKDVGTDAGRYLGMQHFAEKLNKLQISKTMQTIIEPQKGYVPPPLVGIWARWPYFHNNSAPSLCAVLTEASKRPQKYVAVPAETPEKDFDADCVGYPKVVRKKYREDKNYLYDTRKEGLSNSGHDQKIFIKDGKEVMTAVEKRELIEFLKTL